jgi:hypothetical protein
VPDIWMMIAFATWVGALLVQARIIFFQRRTIGYHEAHIVLLEQLKNEQRKLLDSKIALESRLRSDLITVTSHLFERNEASKEGDEAAVLLRALIKQLRDEGYRLHRKSQYVEWLDRHSTRRGTGEAG